MVYLKEMVQFLNQKIHVELSDVTFANRPETYPLKVVSHLPLFKDATKFETIWFQFPADLRGTIEKALKDVDANLRQWFYDYLLTSMVDDMGKNVNVVAHRVFLQCLALNEPALAVTNLSRHVALRNSYQNRQAIGLSLLWALGQGGVKDFRVGLKVFQELMLPVIELKNYSHYVIKYLIDLINRHSDSAAVSNDQYLLILDVAFGTYKNFPNDQREQLHCSLPILRAAMVRTGLHGHFNSLLRKLTSSDGQGYKRELCGALVACLKDDPSSYATWGKCYSKYLPQSATLISHIGE